MLEIKTTKKYHILDWTASVFLEMQLQKIKSNKTLYSDDGDTDVSDVSPSFE